jgi:Dullard-like phosphatase family protein
MNNLFHKSIKVQMLIFSSLLVTLNQLGLYEISSMIKNHFHKIIKELANPILNLFELFIHEELNINYPDMIKTNLRTDFNDRFNKLYIENKISKGYKNSEILSMINKNIDKSSNSLKYYSTLNLKYSLIKPFGDSLNQLLISIERKNLKQYSNIILNTILFGELEVNRNKLLTRQMLINSINNIPPFLPPIDSKYKYTLVLDMDETLIHFFFTHINGMFFVRPFCFDFLNELNELYEIITFTAGTKDYADNILNQLDINGDIIKYRLYRQHTSIVGCNVYKDLSKIGRDLSKTIIIDNLRENFKMQPNNGIFIKTWTSDINDTQFRDLKKVLKEIVEFNIPDVRVIISKINEDIRISKNLINPYININISKYIK